MNLALVAGMSAFLVMGVSASAVSAAGAQSPESGSAAVTTKTEPASVAVVPLVAKVAEAKADADLKADLASETPVATKVATVKPAAPPTTLRISIDLSSQRMTVKDNGKTIHSWAISSGRAGYRTITGNFRPQWQTRMHYSRKYDNAPMPNAIFFKGGFAIHGTYATGMLGRPASHGCIRLAPANAKKLYDLVQSHGRSSTSISVYGTARDSSPAVASSVKSRRTRQASQYAGSGASWLSDAPPPRREARPRIIYRNGQAYMYVGREKARQYYRSRYSGSYYNY